MDISDNPYHELPYRSRPIEWTAPERLALSSLLHGGPRAPLDSYRVLELGCNNGANLLPLAYYRRHAQFVGIDGARLPIATAEARRSELKLSNIEFIHTDFRHAKKFVSGHFNYIIAHGIFSWVSESVRDELLELIAHCLCPGGLVYLNYNAQPGWKIRGMIREFLISQTADEDTLSLRVQRAKAVAGNLASSLSNIQQPYSQLLANEFHFVCQGDDSWVGHEYLEPDNHSYWRREFLSLARRAQLEYVADADFNYNYRNVPQSLLDQLRLSGITGHSVEETIDLLCYRQVHSPILTPSPFHHAPPSMAELGCLWVASCMEPLSADQQATHKAMFRHPSGYEVETRAGFITSGLKTLAQLWPRGMRASDAFPDLQAVIADLRLLHLNGLIELRCTKVEELAKARNPLNQLELGWDGYMTGPDHSVQLVQKAT